MRLFLVFILSINVIFANDIVPMQKDGKEGFWVSKEAMTTFRQMNEERKLLEEKNIKLEQLGVAKDDRIGFYKSESDEYYRLYKKSESKTFWKSAAFFALGVVVTGFASYATIKALK